MDPLSCKFFQMYPVKDISFQVSRISSASLNESFVSSDRTRAMDRTRVISWEAGLFAQGFDFRPTFFFKTNLSYINLN